VERTYLYVPPEEKAEVEALGARWDDKAMCWYIGADDDAARFLQWLPDREEDEEFTITSEQAHVASTAIACWECHSTIEVICIHCESGTVAGEPLTQFTVSGIWAMDDALARQLVLWPSFRKCRTRICGEVASPITARTVARCRMICIFIPSRANRSLVFRAPRLVR